MSISEWTQGIDLEKAVLGAALSSRRAIDDLDMVRDTHFQDIRHAALWRLIQHMHSDGERVDPLTVYAALPRIPQSDRTGLDAVYLHDLVASIVTAAAAPAYGRALVNQSNLHRLRSAVTRSMQILDGAADADEAIETVRGLIDGAQPDGVTETWIGPVLDQVIDDFHKPSVYIETPWAALNGLITGWRPGGLYVVGARPGAGKSIIGIQAAVALAHTGPVALSTLEMTGREVAQRVIAAKANVSQGRMKGVTRWHAGPSNADTDNARAAAQALARLPLSVDDRPGITITDIRAHARRVSRAGHLAGIVVDYLQLMTSQPGDRRPRHEIVADHSRQLKLLAKELDCPVIILSQLNRASESRESGAPTMADLRESGAIEQDADVVLLLHVPQVDGPGGVRAPENDRLIVTVAKNRQGPIGRVTLARDGEHARISDLPATSIERTYQ